MPHQNTNARRGTNSEDIVDTELVFWMRRARRKKRGMGKLCKSVRVSGSWRGRPFVGRAVARHPTGMKLLYCLNAPIVALDSSNLLILIAISGPRC